MKKHIEWDKVSCCKKCLREFVGVIDKILKEED